MNSGYRGGKRTIRQYVKIAAVFKTPLLAYDSSPEREIAGMLFRWAADDPGFLALTHRLRQENIDRWLDEDEVYAGISTKTLQRRIEIDRIVCELANDKGR